MSTARFPSDPHTTSEDPSANFAVVSRRLHAIANRILRNREEAEDVVQDAWVRWHTCDRTDIRNPTAFLVTATKRLAINAAQSARVRRETTAGDRFPDQVDDSQDPAAGAERREALEDCVSRLLERLPQRERAAYVLRQAFDYPYPAIASMLDLTEANTRQLVSRAGKRLRSTRSQPVSAVDRQQLVAAFRTAVETGDASALERGLAA